MAKCIYCGSAAAYWSISDKENNTNYYCDPCFQSHNLAAVKKEMDEYHTKKRQGNLSTASDIPTQKSHTITIRENTGDNRYITPKPFAPPKKSLSVSQRPEESSNLFHFRYDENERDSAYRIMTERFSQRFTHLERRNTIDRPKREYWIVCNENASYSDIKPILENAGCAWIDRQYVDYWLIVRQSVDAA